MADKSERRMAFDFGEFSQADFDRILKELSSAGYKQKVSVSDAMMAMSERVAQMFLDFAAQMLRELGLFGQAANGAVSFGVDLDAPADTPAKELMRRAWNARAEQWAIIESPISYYLTMLTLVEHLRFDERAKSQTLLSLGSGPGLYETFLGSFIRQSIGRHQKIRLFAVDYARAMSARHQEILAHSYTPDGRRLTNVIPLTGDMTTLPLKSQSVDQVICNNALQWADDWQQVIAEISRVMRPTGIRTLYLFVHTHPMQVFSYSGEKVFEFGSASVEEILDELEAHRFEIHKTRQLGGPQGTGQAGQGISRVFILARYQPVEAFTPWREKKVSATLRGARFGK